MGEGPYLRGEIREPDGHRTVYAKAPVNFDTVRVQLPGSDAPADGLIATRHFRILSEFAHAYRSALVQSDLITSPVSEALLGASLACGMIRDSDATMLAVTASHVGGGRTSLSRYLMVFRGREGVTVPVRSGSSVWRFDPPERVDGSPAPSAALHAVMGWGGQ